MGVKELYVEEERLKATFLEVSPGSA